MLLQTRREVYISLARCKGDALRKARIGFGLAAHAPDLYRLRRGPPAAGIDHFRPGCRQLGLSGASARYIGTWQPLQGDDVALRGVGR